MNRSLTQIAVAFGLVAATPLRATAAECAPSAKDTQLVAVRYAEAVDDIAKNGVATGIGKLQTLLRRYPWFTPAQLTIARTEDQRGAWMSAYIAYRRYLASQVHPDDLASIEERIEALVEKSKALGLFVEGERAAQRENWPRATQLMRQTLEEKPNFSPAYRLLGRALAAQGQFTAAAAALRRYLELDPLAPDREEIEPLIDEYERALLEVVP